MKLTEKQKRFCEEYLVDLNATQAAIRAGYSPKTSSRIAVELLNKTHVLEFLKQLREKQSERTGITADTVLKELEKIAVADVEVSGKEKIKALELLGKHLGLFDGSNQSTEAGVENNLIDILKEGAASDLDEVE